jgi:hypothetical protein
MRPLGDPLQLDSVSLQERARRARRRRPMANTGKAGPHCSSVKLFNARHATRFAQPVAGFVAPKVEVDVSFRHVDIVANALQSEL